MHASKHSKPATRHQAQRYACRSEHINTCLDRDEAQGRDLDILFTVLGGPQVPCEKDLYFWMLSDQTAKMTGQSLQLSVPKAAERKKDPGGPPSVTRPRRQSTLASRSSLTRVICNAADQDAGPSRPRKRQTHSKQRKRAAIKKSRKVERVIEYIKVPKQWFSNLVNQSMKTVVRPPTKKTRRKEVSIDLRIPQEIFTARRPN